jgi:DinB superfamily
MEKCEVCGFAWETVDRDEIGRRVDAGTARIAALIVADPARSAVRPTAQRWSATQYAAHVRDVLQTLRDRMVIGIVEDNPSFKPMYRDERVELGLYDPDPAEAVATELRAATAMFTRLFEAVDPRDLSRPVQYGYPSPVQRSLLWMGQQAVHEVEHHGDDIAENLGAT